MRRWLLAWACGVFVVAASFAKEATPVASVPSKVGFRKAVIEFSSVAGATPTNIEVVTTESVPLSDLVQSLLVSGQIKTDTAGVSKITVDRYRAVVDYPVPDDGEPLPADVVPPQIRLQQAPTYPFELRRKGIVGGVVVRVEIDEKAKVGKVEMVSTSAAELWPGVVAAVRRWKFAKPAMRNNQPIAVTLIQLITFESDTAHAPVRWQISPEPKLPELVVTGSYIPTQ